MAVSTQRPVGQRTPPHSEAPVGADSQGDRSPGVEKVQRILGEQGHWAEDHKAKMHFTLRTTKSRVLSTRYRQWTQLFKD